MLNLPCPSCGRYKTRGITVDALIIKKSKLLLIKRKFDPYKNKWALPGGHVDLDETVEEGVIREVAEETGLTVTLLKLLGLYSDPSRHPGQYIAASFIVTKFKGTAQAGDDAKDLKFFSFDEIPQNLAFDHKKIVGDYLRIRNKF